MNEQWYWETKGELFGPLSTNELEGLISAKKIRASDRLKLGEKGEWLSGSEVMDLVGTSPAGSSSSTAQSADDVLHNMQRRQVERLVAGGDSSVSVTDSVRSVGKLVKAMKDTTTGLLAAGVGAVFSTRGKYATLAVSGLVIILVVIGRMDLTSTSASELHSGVFSLVSEAASLKDKKVENKEWQEFVNNATPVVSEITAELEQALKNGGGMNSAFVFKQSRLEYAVKYELHQVTKYELPRILQTSAGDNVDMVPCQRRLENAAKFMAEAEFLSSWAVDWRSVGFHIGLPRSWIHTPIKTTANQPAAAPFDWTTAAMIVVDVLVAGWLLWAFRSYWMFWKNKPARV
jgi:hypothetical protein